MKDEHSKLFLKYLRDSIQISSTKNKNLIFYVYDEQLILKNKLNSCIDDNKIIQNLMLNDYKDKIIFEFDLLNKYFFIDHDKIWAVFNEKYGYNSTYLRSFFGKLLKKNNYKQKFEFIGWKVLNYYKPNLISANLSNVK